MGTRKVVFVLDAFGFFGGPERRAFRLAKGMRASGFAVDIVSIMRADQKMLERAHLLGIGAYQLTDRGNSVLKSYRIDVFLKLRRLLGKLDPDMVFTFEFLADYTAKMAMLDSDIPFYTFIGSTRWKWERKRHRRFFMRRFVGKSRAYIVNSRQVMENLVRVLPESAHKVHLLYNPIETDIFHPLDQQAKMEAKKRFGLDDSFKVVGSVVRFFNPKGADVLIKAFSRLKREPCKLLLVGDGSMRGRLERMVEELDLKGMVIFAGAMEATSEVYGAFDISVVPSQKGGFDNVVVESMACGLPTVATAETGIGELAKDGEHLLITKKDADSIGKAIQRLLSDEGYAERLAINARKFVEDQLSLERVTQRLVEILNR